MSTDSKYIYKKTQLTDDVRLRFQSIFGSRWLGWQCSTIRCMKKIWLNNLSFYNIHLMLYDVGWIDIDVKMLYITDLHTADREEDLYVCTLFSL